VNVHKQTNVKQINKHIAVLFNQTVVKRTHTQKYIISTNTNKHNKRTTLP